MFPEHKEEVGSTEVCDPGEDRQRPARSMDVHGPPRNSGGKVLKPLGQDSQTRGVGVQVASTFTLKRLDQDYFDGL